MEKANFSDTLERIVQDDPRYNREAYVFVREGLDFTLKQLRKQGETSHRHVSGQELLEGLRQYSLDQFGPMSKTVLNYWGITCCESFADVVFNLVDRGVLGKTEQDSREDFAGGFDFDEAFVKPFLPPSRTRTADRPTTAAESADAPPRSTTPSSQPQNLSGGAN